MDNYFTFVGEFDVSKDENKPSYTADVKWNRMNFMVVENKNNRGFIEVMGYKNDEINTYDEDGNAVDINWADRLDPNAIKEVRFTNKFSVQLPNESYSERHEFITEYDMAKFLHEHESDLKGERVIVHGRTNKSFYNGRSFVHYQANSVRPASDELKNELRINPVVWFRKEDIDLADWNKEHTIYINGYTEDFIRAKELGKDKGENRYTSQQIVFHLNVDDFSTLSEADLTMTKVNLLMLGIDFDTKTFKVTKSNKLKDKAVYVNQIGCHLKNGAEEKPFDITMLTDMQKMQIECGLKKIEDFKPTNGIMGGSVSEWRYSDIPMKMEKPFNFKNGYIVADDKYSEFEDKIFVPANNEETRDDDLSGNMPEPEDVEFPPKEEDSKAKARSNLFD